MNLIVAVDKNWGIGCENKLLFRIPDDLKNFRKLTTDKVVVMGRKTLESLPGGLPLKNRTNIVLSRNEGLQIPGAVVCRSLDDLLAKTEEYNIDDMFVIGGQTMYQELLPHCKFAYITKIDAVSPADTFFPNIDNMSGWAKVEESETMNHECLQYTFCLYENKR